MSDQPAPPRRPRTVRWWPAGLILLAAALGFGSLRFVPHVSQQEFNIQVAKITVITSVLLLLWIMLFSRMRWRARLAVLGLVIGGFGLMAAVFRIHGVSGNLVPILEPRWVRREFQTPVAGAPVAPLKTQTSASDFPQFLGPNRDGRLAGPNLATNWTEHPPAQLWRVPVGAAWSGFAVVGAVAVTQEQRGADECVTAYDLPTGKVLWVARRQKTLFHHPGR